MKYDWRTLQKGVVTQVKRKMREDVKERKEKKNYDATVIVISRHLILGEKCGLCHKSHFFFVGKIHI